MGRRGSFIFLSPALVISSYIIGSENGIGVICACISALICVLIILIPSWKSRSALICAVICLLGAAGGFIRSALYVKSNAEYQALKDGSVHSAFATVDEISYEKVFGSGYFVTVSLIDGKKAGFKTYLEIPYMGNAEKFDEISFEATFAEPDADEKDYLRSDGVYIKAEGNDIEKTGRSGGIRFVAYKINSYLCGELERLLPPEEASFAKAVALGNREELSPSVKLDFKRLGISHLLALSGLHLAIIVLGADIFLRIFKMKKQLRVITVMLLTVAFAFITGLSPSVQRASLMILISYFSYLLGRQNDAVTALSVSLSLILLISPGSVWDAGLWLSFSATLGITLFPDALSLPLKPVMRTRKTKLYFIKSSVYKVLSYIFGLFAANVTATVFTLPVIYMLFGGISLLSLPSNLLFVPLVQITLYLIMPLLVISRVPLVSGAFSFISEKLISFVLKLSSDAAKPFGIYVSVKYSFLPWLILLFFASLILIIISKKRKRYAVLVLSFLLCVSFCVCYFIQSRNTEEDLYLNCETYNKNDAVCAVYKGYSMAIDISNGGWQVTGDAVNALCEKGEAEIDAYMLTHLHKNHIRTVEKLLERVKVGALIIPEAETENDLEIFDSIRKTAEEYNTCIVVYSRRSGCVFKRNGLSVVIPGYIKLKRSTHPVIRFDISVQTSDRKFSYIGASYFEAQTETVYTDTVFFGIHGPVIKQSAENAEVYADTFIYSDSNVYKNTPSDGNPVILSESGGAYVETVK